MPTIFVISTFKSSIWSSLGKITCYNYKPKPLLDKIYTSIHFPQFNPSFFMKNRITYPKWFMTMLTSSIQSTQSKTENLSVLPIPFFSPKMATNNPSAPRKRTESIKPWNSLPKKKLFNWNWCLNSLSMFQNNLNSEEPFEVHRHQDWKYKKAQHPTERKIPLKNCLALCPNSNFHKKDITQSNKSTCKVLWKLKIIRQTHPNVEKLKTMTKLSRSIRREHLSLDSKLKKTLKPAISLKRW